MSRGIFDKWRAAFGRTRNERGLSVATFAGARDDRFAGSDMVGGPIDGSLLLLSRELSGLTGLPVSAAAKERGWAALQREMERHPVKASKASAQGSRGAKGVVAPAAKGVGGGARTVHPRNLKWALGSAVGVVAIVAAVLGSYSGGLLQTGGDGDGPGTVASVITSDTTAPDTTVPDATSSATTPTTVPAAVGPVTTGGVDGGDVGRPTETTGPVVTDGPVTTDGTQPTAPVGGEPNTPGTTSGTSGSGSAGTGSSTTQPPRTTTTGQQQMATMQRIGSAQAAVVYLADLVITGNTSGARALVAPEAQSGLAHMIASLTDPNGHKIIGAQTLSDDTVRVSLQITDRVVNNAGEYVQKDRGFVIRVRVDGEDAVITAINAGS